MRSTMLSLTLLAAVAVVSLVPAKASAGYPYRYYGSSYYAPSYYGAYVAPSYYGAYSYYTPSYYATPSASSYYAAPAYAAPGYGAYPAAVSSYGAYSYGPNVSYYSPGYRRGFTAFPGGSFYISP